MTEPEQVLVHYVAVGSDSAGQWQTVSRYQIWSRHYDSSSQQLGLLERRPEGFVRIPERPRLFHVIPAGTAHHVEHLFGFWRISESDTTLIRIETNEGISYSLIVGTHSPDYNEDLAVWFCQQCGTELHREHFETKRFGLPAFWDKSLEFARAFNTDMTRRTCGQCGAVHPLAYGFGDHADDRQEMAARASW